MKKVLFVLMILFVSICAGCGGGSYKHLTQEEAIKMMSDKPDAIILDVRKQESYDRKHIPNAILVPLDDLKNGNFTSLPDKNATILVYCQAGRHAPEAAKILADKGYKNVYEIGGGILDWTGELEGTEMNTYKQISQTEAMDILATNPNARLLDCRFPKDYELKHIPGAINFTLEAAVAENFEKIPDKDAPLITYCGDGNRGKLTAKVLVQNGYKNVYTMGGIIEWKGEVEGTEVDN